MDHTNPNFVSFMQTNYNTVRVSFLPRLGGAAPAAPRQPAPAMPSMPAPAWSNERPWVVPEELNMQAQTGPTLYSYKVPKEMELKVGDFVVVPSADTIAFARVEVVDEIPSLDFTKDVTYKWIIDKVNFDHYNELVKAENEFQRKMEAVQRMRVQQEAVKTMREQFLSNTDPHSAALFADALKSIGAQVPTAPIATPESK